MTDAHVEARGNRRRRRVVVGILVLVLAIAAVAAWNRERVGVLTVLALAGVVVYELVRTAQHDKVLLRTTDRAEYLATLAEELSMASTIADVAAAATTTGRRPVGAAATSIGLIEGSILRVQHGDTVPPEYRSTWPAPPLDADLAFTRVARTGETMLFEDQASYERAFPKAEGPAVGGRAVLPLRRADGARIGAIAHLWHGPLVLDDTLLSTLRTIADLTGQALERARLTAMRAEVARHSQQLARWTEGLATSRSSRDVIELLTKGVVAPLGASHAAVGLIEGDSINRHLGPGAEGEVVTELLPPTIPLESAEPLAEAARTGEMVLLDSEAAVRSRYPHLADAWMRLGLAATANLPLCDQSGQSLGALGVGWIEPVDLEALRDRLATVASIAGQTLDRALRSDAEHSLVRTLQKSLLPPLPGHPDLTIAARYLPAAHEVGMGGDWYEAIAHPDGRFDIVVGDVAGHGITAVGQMAQLRSVIGAMAALDVPVEDLFPLATALPGHDGPIIASAALVQMDLAAGRIRYACAGHPQPLLRLPGGQVITLDDGRQPLLGIQMSERSTGTHAFPPGSLLVAYSDGLVERRGETIDESIERLACVLARLDAGEPGAVADALVAELLGDDEPDDDVVVVVVSHNG